MEQGRQDRLDRHRLTGLLEHRENGRVDRIDWSVGNDWIGKKHGSGAVYLPGWLFRWAGREGLPPLIEFVKPKLLSQVPVFCFELDDAGFQCSNLFAS